MTAFTKDNLTDFGNGKRLCADVEQLADKPLWYHDRGLSQTASGYGAKLTTPYMVHFEGKLRRVYSTCYGNSGSCWFIFKGEKVWIS